MERPFHIDLPPRIPASYEPGVIRSPGAGSPRTPMTPGLIAPDMSPLDAFAAQSRRLAQQLEEESLRTGRRVSRLAPSAVATGLGRKPLYSSVEGHVPSASTVIFDESSRSRSRTRQNAPPPGQGHKPAIEQQAERPISTYPRISQWGSPTRSQPSSPRTSRRVSPTPYSQSSAVPPAMHTDFQMPRARSPDSEDNRRPSLESSIYNYNSTFSRSQSSFDSIMRREYPDKQTSADSYTSSRGRFYHGLQPPNPPYARKTPSIRSVESDDDRPALRTQNSDSRSRKLSSSSSASQPVPMSPNSSHPKPVTIHHERTASQSSEFSLSSQRLSRAPLNFSRPLSRVGRPWEPSRMSSIDNTSQPVNVPQGSTSNTNAGPASPLGRSILSHDGSPLYHEPPRISLDQNSPPAPSRPSHKPSQSVTSIDRELNISSARPSMDERPSMDDQGSYIHATYSLPRGRMVARDSIPFEMMVPKFSWENNPQAKKEPSPTGPVLTEQERRDLQADLAARPSLDLKGNAKQVQPRRSLSTINSGSTVKPSNMSIMSQSVYSSYNEDRPSQTSPPLPSASFQPNALPSRQPTQTSINSASATAMTAEDHLNKGIACHEKGATNESTYHLRIAANAGLPNAMLLYALACRHGWGMRANPAEAIVWLRRAMASTTATNGMPGNVSSGTTSLPTSLPEAAATNPALRTQFSLAVYELGMSYLNGWGTTVDKGLAVQCFKLASDWGDADATAECGFCYTKGIGVKKDLKIAAGYYRLAEKRGVSMVGNSWIHKSKYDPPAAQTDSLEPGSPAPKHKKGKKSADLFPLRGRDRTKSVSAATANQQRDLDALKTSNTFDGALEPETPKKRDKSRTRSIFSRKKSMSHINANFNAGVNGDTPAAANGQ